MGQPETPDTLATGRLPIAVALSLALHAAILWGWHQAAAPREPVATRVARIDIRLTRTAPVALPGSPAEQPLPASHHTATPAPLPVRTPAIAQPAPRQPVAPPLAVTPSPSAPVVTTTPTADTPAAPASSVAAAAPANAPPIALPRRTAAVVDPGACAKPEYPRASLRNEETGTVSLAFLIGADGAVQESRVERSSGHRRLDEAARAALSLCRFAPATVDGRPEPAWARLDYVWRIE